MRETSKCHQMRLDRGDFDSYLRGSIVDIGCGMDPIRPVDGSVRCWDISDGDGALLESIPNQSLECVYSSHCLEHLTSVETAMTNWVRVLKPGGYIYCVIPDWVIYEKQCWPSKFNKDHKHSFSLDITRHAVKDHSHFNLSLDIAPILLSLGCSVVSMQLEDVGYDYSKQDIDQTLGTAMAQLCIIARRS